MLTPKQEAYCQARARGLSQRRAFREAYPHSAKWKDGSVDVNASKLEADAKVSLRVKELQEAAARASVASRTAVIDRMAHLNRYSSEIAAEKASRGIIDKEAISAMMASGSKLLDVLPDDREQPDGAPRVFDFGMILGRGFVDLHRDIQAARFDEYWCEGGRGSLKTSTIAAEIVAGVASVKGRNAVVMRNRTNKLRTSVYAEVKKAARRLDVFGEFAFGKSPLQAVHKPTGNVVYFQGADNVNPEDSPLKGLSFEQGYCAYLWFEEASQFPGYGYIRNVEQTVLRGGDDSPTWTFLSYNPPMSVNAWVNRESREPQDGRIVHRSHFSDVPRAWLGDAFFAIEQALRKRNPKAARHEYDGEAVGTGANVIDPEVIQVRRITDEERGRLEEISHGIDAGSVHPWVHERVGYDVEAGILYVLDEESATGHDAHDTQTAKVLAESLARFGEEDADLWCDSAAPGMIGYYQDQGLAARKAYKQGKNSPRERIRWMNRLAAIVIDPETAPLAAAQFPALEYVITPGGDITETLPKVNDDAIDAVGYAASIWIRQGL
ncbi:MAG: phage terminase large subunit [Eggerthellaceae bacterium]|nr:phage terminase large subunit [Eggerthellaceae bacterium]